MQTMPRACSFFLNPRGQQNLVTTGFTNPCIHQRRCLFLSTLLPFIPVSLGDRHEISVGLVVLDQSPSQARRMLLQEDESNHSSLGKSVLKSAKIRALFQWSRAARTRPLPVPPGKGKLEDNHHRSDNKSLPSSSRHNSEASSSSAPGTANPPTAPTKCWSHKTHCRSGDHDDGPDWDW
ncbi:hypothetical protein P691DRAFT_403947 [Macrolepiota fuliginosa MF-IS2]|uniref:Uncharacterized protein n=1 Tax=Macrolepiota fuliginosa MF-IS2 TaxID=1400762 RepID=A0A9P5X315_9AGAR|nr:hypothetical protein P691DRAFT_403947 [Macrolepiota fuliginosa MF-IS2]